MRRASSAVSCATVATTGVRSMFLFSECNPVLMNNQAAFKSKSNIWIEDWELPRHQLTLKPDENPTIVLVDKRLELFNMSSVQIPPAGLLEPPTHSSFGSQKPYGQKLQFAMTNESQKCGYTSKWWLTKSAIVKNKMSLNHGAKDLQVLFKSNCKVFHASQLTDPSAVAAIPVSGGTRKPYHSTGPSYLTLSAAVAAHNYSTGLFFTTKQLEALKLEVKPAQSPISQSVSPSTTFGFYNLDQMKNPEQILEALGRSPVSKPTFLMSGDTISNELPANKYTSNYWLSGRDAELYNFEIKDEETNKGIPLSDKMKAKGDVKIDMWNADQLVNPKLAFATAGTAIRE